MAATFPTTISEAVRDDAPAIAAIHLAARADAMPYLRPAHTDDETRDYFARVVADQPRTWWVARQADQVAAYLRVHGEDLDHLYVLPGWQEQGLGSALLNHAKGLSPGRLLLWTFQRNGRARAFYERSGFAVVGERQYLVGSTLYDDLVYGRDI